MANLYEINNEILNCIDAETGEIVDVEKLTELQITRDTKIENIALWYKNLVSDAEQYKAEKNAFAEKERVAKNKAESLKNYLDGVLNGETFKTTRATVSYRATEGVVIDDITKIDDAYLKYAEPTADKVAIKKAIKDGVNLDGVHLENRNNISIK